MKPKIYLFPTQISETTPFVKLEDWKELKEQNDRLVASIVEWKAYANRLADLENLPCLPQDLENLRAANAQFAQDNHELLKLAEDLNEENKDLLKRWEDALDRADSLADQLWEKDQEIKNWENKWKIAVEMAAIAENKLDQKTKDFNDLWDNYIEALKKLDKIEEIL